MLEAFLTLVLPGVVAGAVEVIRKKIELVPDRYVPAALMVLGGVTMAGASLLGLDLESMPVPDESAVVASLQGVMGGAVAVGYHQLLRQLQKRG